MAEPLTAGHLVPLELRAMAARHESRALEYKRTTFRKGSWGRAADDLAAVHDRMAAVCRAKLRELEGAMTEPRPDTSTTVADAADHLDPGDEGP